MIRFFAWLGVWALVCLGLALAEALAGVVTFFAPDFERFTMLVALLPIGWAMLKAIDWANDRA